MPYGHGSRRGGRKCRVRSPKAVPFGPYKRRILNGNVPESALYQHAWRYISQYRICILDCQTPLRYQDAPQPPMNRMRCDNLSQEGGPEPLAGSCGLPASLDNGFPILLRSICPEAAMKPEAVIHGWMTHLSGH